jgi:hypothetical protein
MTNTSIGKSNILLYTSREKKLSKDEKLEKYMVNTGGGLYSCINDLIKFAKYIPKLVDICELTKLYFYSHNNDNVHSISHSGGIYGGTSNFDVDYTNLWKIKEIYIKLNTIKG